MCNDERGRLIVYMASRAIREDRIIKEGKGEMRGGEMGRKR